ncbi:DHS-like NAD/FAD-binding domain-containing protein [Kockovaella imperatae]|uniref:DHS-like NAD/FAD-binding domain-containing protein n=1 Tax=Kockovaella imperatae TaxID=4999 RepID=A0A1Y1UF37_9TREE|nr:DHS-like NAD/FAD-binding domain-containing protein [Kockovaella imperatae]ORX36628.1 DHS-like NAD/FAD-binding domain-containing protein [Kockovaella imperatae]
MTIHTLPLNDILASTDPADFSKRRALSDVSRAIARCKRSVVITGAGISCSSGIPDFRSGDGLYSLVKARYPEAFVTGKDLFSSGLFNDPTTTSLFYTFIAELALQCLKAQPTRTHHFIAKLETKGKMLRSYTQNIDGLERRLGLESGGRGMGYKKKATRNVEMHGDLGRVRCILCMTDYEARSAWMAMFREGEAPDCPACEERCSARLSRSARALPVGTLRPSIVLYDEPHPLGEDIGNLQAYDLSRSPDLLLIMGTSLKVHGLKKVVKAFAKAVHARNGMVIFVNATPPSKEWEGVIDYHVQGETDVWVDRVEEEWKKLRPQDWQTQTTLDGGMEIVKDIKIKSKAKAAAKNSSRSKDHQQPVQLPTPRPSESPVKASLPRSSASAASSSLSPAPLSPSKRRANMPPSPISEIGSPSKKRAIFCAPSTGLPATPGMGNLFASPAPPTADSSTFAMEEDDAFGTSLKPAKPTNAKGKSLSRTVRRNTAQDKENVKPSGRVAKTPAVRARPPIKFQ